MSTAAARFAALVVRRSCIGSRLDYEVLVAAIVLKLLSGIAAPKIYVMNFRLHSGIALSLT